MDNIDYDLELGFLKPPEPPKPPEPAPAPVASGDDPLNAVLNRGTALPTVNRSLKPKMNNDPKPNNIDIAARQAKNINIDSKNSLNGAHGLVNTDRNDISAAASKESILKKEGSVEPPKPNRSLKPTSKASLQEEWECTHYELQDKKAELRNMQIDNARLVAEHQARRARLEKDQQDLDRLELLKRKEAKETAELMRQKKKIQHELQALQDEKKWREGEESKT